MVEYSTLGGNLKRSLELKSDEFVLDRVKVRALNVSICVFMSFIII